jgi:creatinine amidohydrolase
MSESPQREHRLALLNRTEIGARAGGALAVLPVGETEQHGPHLATGTDHLIVESIAHAAAEAAADAADVLVAPTIPFGFSAHHLAFGATVSISTRTLSAFLEDACRSLLASGFPRLIILNGHGGNDELVRVVARQVATDTGQVVAATSYWVLAWDRLVNLGVQRFGRLPGHAGVFETSMLTALRPDIPRTAAVPRTVDHLVRSRYYPDVHVEDQESWGQTDGYSDNPAAADPELGRRAAEEVIAAVADTFRSLAPPTGRD